jgi:hypothetical protein
LFKFEVDASEIERLANKMQGELLPQLQAAVNSLSVQTHAHILEEVNQKLHSSRQTYIDNLHWSQINDNTYLISLDKNAWWIEDGIPPNTEMIDALLRQSPNGKSKSGPKTAKDGSTYRVIPFLHSKGPTQQTSYQQESKEIIRKELQRRGIPYAKLEMGGDGTPKIGKLHSFDIMSKPVKTKEGPGQGWGDIGKVKQGPTGIPFLQGVSIYQSEVTTKDRFGKENKSVQRQILTFRVVSSKHKGTGRWMHPGFEGKKFLEEGLDWAKKEWDSKILPDILRSL